MVQHKHPRYFHRCLLPALRFSFLEAKIQHGNGTPWCCSLTIASSAEMSHAEPPLLHVTRRSLSQAINPGLLLFMVLGEDSSFLQSSIAFRGAGECSSCHVASSHEDALVAWTVLSAHQRPRQGEISPFRSCMLTAKGFVVVSMSWGEDGVEEMGIMVV